MNNREIDNRAYPLAVCQQVPPEWNWLGLKRKEVTLPRVLKQAGYTTLIEGMDNSLGDLMDHVEAEGGAENTLFIFLGDNGGDCPHGLLDGISSSAPLRGRKGAKWVGGLRVPFISAWAKRNPNNAWQKKLPIPAAARATSSPPGARATGK